MMMMSSSNVKEKDKILTHILSFLPLKDAFRTTILSKRWRQLPYSLEILNIDDLDVDEDDTNDWLHFTQLVDKVILSPTSDLLDLSILCLSSHRLSACSTFDKWVEAAKQWRVEYLDLYLLNVRMAPTLFCCKTLVHLSLSSIRLSNMFGCSFDLPLLRRLFLKRVRFDDDNVRKNLMWLISTCPLLEILYISLAADQPSPPVTVGGYFKPLSKLNTAGIGLFEVPFQAVYNVKYLRIDKMGNILHSLEINLYYKGFTVFSNLTELTLRWTWPEGIHDWDEVVRMLHKCPKLQTLTLVKGSDSTTKEDWKYPFRVPECVSSHLINCKIDGYEAFDADFRFATYILQNARFLQNMTICHTLHPKPMENPIFLEGLSSCPRTSPACKLLFPAPEEVV